MTSYSFTSLVRLVLEQLRVGSVQSLPSFEDEGFGVIFAIDAGSFFFEGAGKYARSCVKNQDVYPSEYGPRGRPRSDDTRP